MSKSIEEQLKVIKRVMQKREVSLVDKLEICQRYQSSRNIVDSGIDETIERFHDGRGIDKQDMYNINNFIRDNDIKVWEWV